MQSGSTNNSNIQSQKISALSQSRGINETAKVITRKSSKVSDKDNDTEITKALSSIATARKVAGENRGGTVTKAAIYTAAILNELNRKDEKIGAKFLQRFQANLALTKQSNAEAIKPAAHQALNDLVRSATIKIEDAKQATHVAWKIVYKDLPAIEVKPTPVPTRTSSKTVHTRSLGPLVQSRSTVPTTAITSSVTIEAPGGFLWKPIADSPPHGLAVLLPAAWTDEIQGLEIVDPESGDVLAKGADGGVGNGDRQHFRFNQPGADFPDGSIVRISFRDGSVRDIAIENTSSRIEGR